MDTVQNQILDRIRSTRPGSVFIPKDFLDLGGRDAVDQALARLVRRGVIQRLRRGLYARPRINKRLGVAVPPDPRTIADAIGRQTGSRVVPSGAIAANQLGLSSQVPAKLVFLTDGRSRDIQVGSRVYHMRHVAAKRLPAGDSPSDLALHAIRDLGVDAIDDAAVGVLRRRLSRSQRTSLLHNARYDSTWVADVARKVAMTDKSNG